MSKLNDKNDGAGGPGDVLGQMGYGKELDESQSIDKPRPTKGMVVFNRIPKSRINYTIKPTISIKDGVGGPGDGRESYSGPSISSYLSSIGKDPSYSARAVLAANHGIQGYAGTADQNTQLLNQLRSGVASPDPMPLKSTARTSSYNTGNSITIPSARNTTNKLGFSGSYPTFNSGYSVDPTTMSNFNQVRNTNLNNIRPDMNELLKRKQFENLELDLEEKNKTASDKVSSRTTGRTPESWDIDYKTTGGFTPKTTDRGTYTPTASRVKSGDFEGLNKQISESKKSWTPPGQKNGDRTTKDAEEFTTPMVLDEEGNPSWPVGSKNETNEVFQVNKKGDGIQLEVLEGAQGGQCGRFVNNYLGASMFGDSFEQKMSNANVTDPIVGDVVIFDVGEFGHVAVIESINPDGTLNIVGSNADGLSEKVTRNTVDAKKASGFYRPGEPTNISTPKWNVANAVAGNMGAKGFAQQANQLPVGKELRESVYDSYGIKETESLITKMQTAGATLPANVTTFIKTSDSALENIDKNIEEYTTDIMENMDMSDPGNAAKAKAQLGYLYTLRARQNQTYVGYLNDAVEQHQAQLDGMVTKYGLDLKNAQEEINDGTADYERMSESLASMYTEMKEAPELALRMSILQSESITKEKESIAAGIKKDEKLSYPYQKKAIQDMKLLTDINGYTLPEADIQSFIINNDQDENSIIKSDFALQTYMDSVLKTMSAQESEDVGPGDVISKEYKEELAKTSIKQLLGLQNSIKDDDSMAGIFNSIEYMVQDIASSYGKAYAENIDDETSSKIMEAVEDLAPGGPWYKFGTGYGTPQEEDEFIDAVRDKTGGSLEDSVAKAIYAAFRLASEAGGDNVSAPQDVVNSFLYPMSSTEDRASKEKRTPAEFAYLLGGIISDQFVQVILKELNEY